ncbi:MAG: hypothetical protein R2851_21125 [Caldilineaceae bacterium]
MRPTPPSRTTNRSQTIAAARYTIDAPAWITGTVTYAMNAPAVISTTATLTASVDTTDWSAGRHTVFVEAQDSDGNWGVPTAVFVDVLAAHAVALGGVTTQAGKPGETITYTLALTNTGVMTDSFTVFHTLPPELTWDVAQTPGGIARRAAGRHCRVRRRCDDPGPRHTRPNGGCRPARGLHGRRGRGRGFDGDDPRARLRPISPVHRARGATRVASGSAPKIDYRRAADSVVK